MLDYLAKGKTDVQAVCSIENFDWTEQPAVNRELSVMDADETQVARAGIPIYETPRGRPMG